MPVNPIKAQVQLRIEGDNNTTIFEGSVSTIGHDISKPPGETHRCDGTNNNAHPLPGPTCTSALDDASSSSGFQWDGKYFLAIDDYMITSIGGTEETTEKFWGIYLNYQHTPVGGGQQYVRDLDEVLFAFDAFSPDGPKVALKLTGPRQTRVNEGVTLLVTDGATGKPVAGATVNEGTTSGEGNVTITFVAVGSYAVKAQKDGSIRSNNLKLEVYP